MRVRTKITQNVWGMTIVFTNMSCQQKNGHTLNEACDLRFLFRIFNIPRYDRRPGVYMMHRCRVPSVSCSTCTIPDRAYISAQSNPTLIRLPLLGCTLTCVNSPPFVALCCYNSGTQPITLIALVTTEYPRNKVFTTKKIIAFPRPITIG